MSDDAPPQRVDTLTLVGTLSSDQGAYAFFEGSSPEYRKVLSQGKKVANYTLTQIAAHSVTLESGTNRIELLVGMQMRRVEEGEWRVAGGRPAYAAPITNSSDGATASVGDDSEIVKKLMQQREQELR